MNNIKLALLLSFFTLICPAQWEPGKVLSPETVSREGLDTYFCSEPISDAVFARIWLKSFKRDCTTPRESLRYLRLLHVNKDGRPQTGELICNKAIASDLLDIFRQLYTAGYRIEKIRLVDEYNADDEASMTDNNTSCFNFRRINGSKTLSRHSTGMAIDINPLYNPCLNVKSGLAEPAAGKSYARSRKNKQGQTICFIDTRDLCYKLFIAHGFIWGGNWPNPKDYQHFEKR